MLQLALKYWKPLALSLALLILVTTSYQRGKNQCELKHAAELSKQKSLLIKEVERNHEIHREIDRLPDGAAASELRKSWARTE